MGGTNARTGSGQGGPGTPGGGTGNNPSGGLETATVFDPAGGTDGEVLNTTGQQGEGPSQVVGKGDGLTLQNAAQVPLGERPPPLLGPGHRRPRPARHPAHPAGARPGLLRRPRRRANDLTEPTVTPEEYVERARAIEEQIGRVIVGQAELVRHVLVCLLCEGHVLLEGVPGLGKTMLLKTLAAAVDLPFSRVQFTPDLMPADILGTQVLEEDEAGRRSFRFRPGPIFASLVLADEVNRATPKTQSALLEAMQERAVTVAGETRPLPRPFLVMATQNPIEMEGTYPLPEAQLDRFLLKVLVPFPPAADLVAVVERTTGDARPQVDRVADAGRPHGHDRAHPAGAGRVPRGRSTPSTWWWPPIPTTPRRPTRCAATCASARRPGAPRP